MPFEPPVRNPFSQADLEADPFEQFSKWFEEAKLVNPMPEAMTLATVDSEGRPDARMVLLKGHGPDGFRFFTNYEGVKSGQLAANPVAALVFFWPELDRQVRVRGEVSRLAAEASDQYFASRDRNSRVGAWASPQSRPLPGGREELERRAAAAEAEFEGRDVPRPAHWGGFLIAPFALEFWQGREARLHDRFRFERASDGGWNATRLAP